MPEVYEKLYNCIIEGYDIVWCDVTIELSDKRFISRLDASENPSEMLGQLLKGEYPGWMCNKLISVDFYNKCQVFQDTSCSMMEDVLVMTQLLYNKANIEASRVKKTTGAKLVSVLHFSPLHKKNITKNSFFIRYKLGNRIKRYFIDTLLFLKFWMLINTRNEKAEGAYFKYIYKNSTKVVLLSNKFIPIFKNKAKLNETQKIIAINNPAVLQTADKDYKKKKKVIWCGRLGYDMKRIDKMISIWKHISSLYPDWELNILDSGDSNYFKQLTLKYQIKNISFIGFCDPVPYYKEAAVLCMTSVTEGWGMVVAEAQSFGCVPIAYNSFESLSDLITNGENGYVVPAFDEKEYVQKLSTLMNDSMQRTKMAHNSQISVQHFDSSSIIAQQWLNLFDNILKFDDKNNYIYISLSRNLTNRRL